MRIVADHVVGESRIELLDRCKDESQRSIRRSQRCTLIRLTLTLDLLDLFICQLDCQGLDILVKMLETHQGDDWQ